MTTISVGMLGCGTVGTGVLTLLNRATNQIAESIKVHFKFILMLRKLLLVILTRKEICTGMKMFNLLVKLKTSQLILQFKL